MEKTIQIQSGKYIFQIEENTQMRDEDILYTAIKIGGNYLDCVSIFITPTEKKNETKRIPKPERCQLLRPWIDEFMKHYLDDVFSNSGWIIPMSINGGGKPRRQTRKRMPTFYVPDGVRLTTNYQMNLGISVNDV